MDVRNSSLRGFSCLIKKPNQITIGIIAESVIINNILLKEGLMEEILLKKIFLLEVFNDKIMTFT